MTFRSKLPKSIGWKRIHYGHYEINRSGLAVPHPVLPSTQHRCLCEAMSWA